MKVVYKSFQRNNLKEMIADVEAANKARKSNGCQFFLDHNSREVDVVLEIFDGCMSEQDRKTIFAIAEKYSGVSFAHRGTNF